MASADRLLIQESLEKLVDDPTPLQLARFDQIGLALDRLDRKIVRLVAANTAYQQALGRPVEVTVNCNHSTAPKPKPFTLGGGSMPLKGIGGIQSYNASDDNKTLVSSKDDELQA